MGIKLNEGRFFTGDNNQVNLVWVRSYSGKRVEVQYLVMPDASRGSFHSAEESSTLSPETKEERRSVEIEPVLIRLDRNARVEDPGPTLPHKYGCGKRRSGS
ncbi:MAG: hypothetical protein R2744_02935 [Bacteroidales bacterium]